MGDDAVEVVPLFSRAISDYRRNPKFVVPHIVELAIGIVLVTTTAIALLMVGLAYLPSLTPRDIASLFFGRVPVMLITLFVFLVISLAIIITVVGAAARAAIISMARESHAEGRTSLDTGLSGVKRYTVKVFLFRVLMGFVFMALFAIGIIPFALGSVSFGVLALVLAALLFLVFYLFVFLTPQFMVTRNVGVFHGIRESMDFVEKNLFPVLVYVAVAIVINIGAAIATNILALPGLFIENEFINMFFSTFHILFSIALGLVIAPYFDIVKTYLVLEV
jgi:hypothetical protein